MTLHNLGKGYVNPEEISHIIEHEAEIRGKVMIKYEVVMKNKEHVIVTKEEMKTYHEKYLRYLDPNYVEVEDVF